MERIRLVAVFLLILATPVFAAADIRIQNANFAQGSATLIVQGQVPTGGSSVELLDADSESVLAIIPVNRGGHFNARLRSSDLDFVPCTVTVRAGSSTATTHLRHAPADCGPPAESFTVTLTGVVTDAPIPFATVTFRVGDQTYSTVADHEGRYEIDVTTDDTDTIVVGEGQGTGEQAHVTFYNILGTFEKLYEAAEDDPEYPITNVSTAKYALLLEANNGEEPDSLESLTLAERSVDGTALLNLAAVIKLIVDDPSYELPSGYATILEFILDESAVNDFIADVTASDPVNNPLENAKTAILADSSLVPGFPADFDPGRYYTLFAAGPTFIGQGSDVFEFNTDGTGRYIPNSFFLFAGKAADMTWAVVDGIIRIQLTEPQVQFSNFWPIYSAPVTPEEVALLEAEGIFTLERQTRILEHDLTLVAAGELVDQVRAVSLTEIYWPPVTLGDGTVIAPTNTLSAGPRMLEMRHSAKIDEIGFSASELVGTWAMYVPAIAGPYYPGGSSQDRIAADLHTFNGDFTGSTIDTGLAFTWNIVGDLLEISYSNGRDANIRVLDRVGLQIGVHSEIVDTVSGNEYGSFNFVIKQDPAFALTFGALQNAQGRYWSSLLNSWRPGHWDGQRILDINQNFGWQFQDDGITVLNRSYGGETFDPATGTWGPPITEFIRTYQATTDASDPAGSLRLEWESLDQSQAQYRRWVPLAVGADGRIYGIEEAWINNAFTSSQWQRFLIPRINVWIETDTLVPDTVVSND